VFDTTYADNGNQFGTVWMANLTGDHEALKDVFHFVAPVQLPVRFTFDAVFLIDVIRPYHFINGQLHIISRL